MGWLRNIFRLTILLIFLGAVGGVFYVWWYAGEKIQPILTPLNPAYTDPIDTDDAVAGIKLQYFKFKSWDEGYSNAAIVTKDGAESSHQLSVLSALSPEQYEKLEKLDYVLVSVDWDQGIRSALGLAEMICAVGVKCVLWDSRGLNQRRPYCTHGLKESGDVTLLINALARRDGKKDLVCAAVGQGYGASTLLQAVPLENRIKALISIDAYASLRESLKRGLPKTIYTHGLLWMMDRRISRIVGYECFDVAAVDKASLLDKDGHLLVINLLQDDQVANLNDAVNIYHQAPCMEKQVWTVHNAKTKSHMKHLDVRVSADDSSKGTPSHVEVILKDDEQRAFIDMIAWLNNAIDLALREDLSPKPQPPNFLTAL